MNSVNCKRSIKPLYWCFILLFLSVFYIPHAYAILNSPGSASPSTRFISLTGASSVSTTMTVVRNNGAGASCGDTVSSSYGTITYLPPGKKAQVYITVRANRLTRTSPCPAGGVPATTTFSFSDSAVIPQSVLNQIHKLGLSQFVYFRAFTDAALPPSPTFNPADPWQALGSVTVKITGSAATGFSVNRQAMRFDDNSIVKLLNAREALKAKADVNYNGSGQLQAFWEVAGPSTAGGVPIFRPLRSVRKYLLSGGDKTTFVSPTLPTTIAGAYMVRMRITSPAPGFDSPIIRYFVGARGASVAPPLPMRLGNPADRVWLSKDTRFNWQDIKSARYYRLEFFAKAAETDIASTLPNLGDDQTSKKPVRLKGSPVAGITLPGDVLQTGISPIVRRHLIAGRWYYWRIVAIDKDGKIVGLSPIREMRIP